MFAANEGDLFLFDEGGKRRIAIVVSKEDSKGDVVVITFQTHGREYCGTHCTIIRPDDCQPLTVISCFAHRFAQPLPRRNLAEYTPDSHALGTASSDVVRRIQDGLARSQQTRIDVIEAIKQSRVDF